VSLNIVLPFYSKKLLERGLEKLFRGIIAKTLLLITLSACSGKDIKAIQTLDENLDSSPIEELIQTPTQDFIRIPVDTRSKEVIFQTTDGVRLAGQFDFPPDGDRFNLVFIIHHSGPVERDSYQYLAAQLVPTGYAVFRFDKRGVGKSMGEYGCCESEDALAAYKRAVTDRPGTFDHIFIIAQSIGTQFLSERYNNYKAFRKPDGIILLSSLLNSEEVVRFDVPVQIIVSDSEPHYVAVSQEAYQAHLDQYHFPSDFFIATGTEHTLFDITQGPIDWADPSWPERFDEDTWEHIKNWLLSISAP
jgi:uncharacterized protein